MEPTALTQTEIFYRLGAALVIGTLIGLQREHAAGAGAELFAGMRTFALLGLLGGAGALAATHLGAPLVLATVLLVVGALLAAAYLGGVSRGAGLTTEAAALVTFMCGAMALWGYLVPAAAVGVATTVLLSLKLELHAFAHSLSRTDIYAGLKFAVLAVIILPLLPDRALGAAPLDVLNPFKIGLLVVFITGISALGYILLKTLGAGRGIMLTGLLGGIVSSTAVTLSFTQRSRAEPGLSRSYALGITVAWTVMFARVLGIAAVISPPLLMALWAPMLAGGLAGLGWCALLALRAHPPAEHEMTMANPVELREALAFAAIYVVILIGVKFAQATLGEAGIYLSSALAGLSDVDAITLSMGELTRAAGGVTAETAARAVVVATLANTAFKSAILLAGGPPDLRRAMLPAIGLTALGAAGVAVLV